MWPAAAADGLQRTPSRTVPIPAPREDHLATRLTPPAAVEGVVETARGCLRILRAGDAAAGAPSAVLIHGGGYDNSAISWFHLFEELGPERQVLAIDLPGFGGSIDVEPVGGPEAMAAVVAEAMEALHVGPAVVFGCSMGGDVALNLALRHPDKVVGLALIGPGGLVSQFKDPATHFMAWAGTRLPDRMLYPATRLANRFVKAAIKSVVHDPAAIPEEVLAEFIAESKHPRAGLAYGRYNQATIGRRRMRNDLSGCVDHIDVPTLIVHGAEDVLVEPEGSRRAAERMPRARLIVQPDCGHWAQLERPAAFRAETRKLLSTIDGRR